MQRRVLVHIVVGTILLLFIISGIATPVYETDTKISNAITTQDGGFSTSLWETCMLSGHRQCKTIDVAALPCDNVAHVLRTARGFSILSVFSTTIIVVGAIVTYTEWLAVPRWVLNIVNIVSSIFLVIAWASMVALYTTKQCPDRSRRAAMDMPAMRLGAGPPLLITACVVQCSLTVLGIMWPDAWDEDGIFFVDEAHRERSKKKKQAAEGEEESAAACGGLCPAKWPFENPFEGCGEKMSKLCDDAEEDGSPAAGEKYKSADGEKK